MAYNKETSPSQIYSAEELSIPQTFTTKRSLRWKSKILLPVAIFTAIFLLSGCTLLNPSGKPTATAEVCDRAFPQVCTARGSNSAEIYWNKKGVKENIYYGNSPNKVDRLIAGIGASQIDIIMNSNVTDYKVDEVTADALRVEVSPLHDNYFRIDDCKAPGDCTSSEIIDIPKQSTSP